MKRYRYRIIIAMERLEDTIKWADRIAGSFSAHFGGCTTYFGEGRWRTDADQYKPLYSGQEMVEDCAVIEVVTTDKCDDLIKSIITNRTRGEHNGQWVHMERERIKCNHFQIQKKV